MNSAQGKGLQPKGGHGEEEHACYALEATYAQTLFKL